MFLCIKMSNVQMFGENYRGLYSTQVGPRPTFSESLCAQSRVTSHLTLVKLDGFIVQRDRHCYVMLALGMSLTVIDGRI